jgi:hypothetical protein
LPLRQCQPPARLDAVSCFRCIRATSAIRHTPIPQNLACPPRAVCAGSCAMSLTQPGSSVACRF